MKETVPDLVARARIENAHGHDQWFQSFADDLGDEGNLGYSDFERHTLL